MTRLGPKRNNLIEGLVIGFAIGVAIMAFALMLSSCAPAVDPENQPQVPDVPAVEIGSQFEKIGCAEDVCVYTFIRGRQRCFLGIGSFKARFDSWMFDLECNS